MTDYSTVFFLGSIIGCAIGLLLGAVVFGDMRLSPVIDDARNKDFVAGMFAIGFWAFVTVALVAAVYFGMKGAGL